MTTRLHAQVIGDGPGDADDVVLLHAFPCSSAMWQAQAVALSGAGSRVVLIDLPGFGRSPLLEADPSLPAVADAVLRTLDEVGVRSAALGGISLGGYVTMAMLAQRPQLAAGVILCDTKATADGEAARENRERLASLVEDSPEDTARILEQAVLPGLLGDTTRAVRSDVVETVRGWLGLAPAATVAWYQRAMAVRPDSTEVLRGLGIPGLVVWGDEDALSPMTEQEIMLDCLGDGWLAVIEGAGHLSNVERPDAVNGVLLDFVTRL